jgi:hypothetical protein
MKTAIFFLVILLGLNLLFFPKKITKTIIDTQQGGNYLAERKVYFFSPVWTNDYKSKFFTIGDFTDAEIQNYVSKVSSGSSNPDNIRVGIKTDASFAIIVESANDIWLIFILIPSIIIFSIVLFLIKRKMQKNRNPI